MKNKSVGGARMHSWGVSPKRAREIQEELGNEWEGKDRLREIRTVVGLDASFVITGSQSLRIRANRWAKLHEANLAIGCAVMYRFPSMEEIARAYATLPLNFPYIPGLLSFREIPVLLEALKKLPAQPDLVFCDGHGYAHPRRFGLACHLGVLLDCASIGCAKSILIGTHGALARRAGSWTPLVDERAGGERMGAVLRTRDDVTPIYVSQGHRISLETAVRLTLAVCDGVRIPRPTRDADHFASEVKRKVFAAHASEK